mgnify:CR=1 FL=1
MFLLVLEQVTDITLVEVRVKTAFKISDFLLSDGIIVVVSGLIDEALVEQSLQENVEIGHEASVVAKLVLREDGHEAVVAFFTNFVTLFCLGEVEHVFDQREVGQTENHDRHTVLYKYNKLAIVMIYSISSSKNESQSAAHFSI